MSCFNFVREQDRTSRSFTFEGIPPNVSSNDYLKEAGIRNKALTGAFSMSLLTGLSTTPPSGNVLLATTYRHGFPRKECSGTGCSASGQRLCGNTTSSMICQTYEKYIYLTRDGVQPRKRNLDACKAWKEAAEEEAEMQAAVKRIRSNGAIYQSFPEVPAALYCKHRSLQVHQCFHESGDGWNKNGAAPAAPTWSLRESPKEL